MRKQRFRDKEEALFETPGIDGMMGSVFFRKVTIAR